MALKYTYIFIVIFIISGNIFSSLIDLHKIKILLKLMYLAFSTLLLPVLLQKSYGLRNFQVSCLRIISLTFLFLRV